MPQDSGDPSLSHWFCGDRLGCVAQRLPHDGDRPDQEASRAEGGTVQLKGRNPLKP